MPASERQQARVFPVLFVVVAALGQGFANEDRH